jgi:transposase
VILGDRAIWIWNLARQHFPGAIEIVDPYHARQRLWELDAICTTRSRTVGIPNGLSFPFAFGMQTRCTACGR